MATGSVQSSFVKSEEKVTDTLLTVSRESLVTATVSFRLSLQDTKINGQMKYSRTLKTIFYHEVYCDTLYIFCVINEPLKCNCQQDYTHVKAIFCSTH